MRTSGTLSKEGLCVCVCCTLPYANAIVRTCCVETCCAHLASCPLRRGDSYSVLNVTCGQFRFGVRVGARLSARVSTHLVV